MILGSCIAVGNLKLHAAGQGFAGHHVEVDTDTLGGVEGTVALGVVNKAIVVEQVVGKGEGGQPGAGHLHFHGGSAVGRGEHHAGGQKKRNELFHDTTSLIKEFAEPQLCGRLSEPLFVQTQADYILPTER